MTFPVQWYNISLRLQLFVLEEKLVQKGQLFGPVAQSNYYF
jgi:hypothetical protein